MINGARGANTSKYPAARLTKEVLKSMIQLHVNSKENDIWVYGPCELGSDEIGPSDEGGPTPLQLWHRDDKNGIGR